MIIIITIKNNHHNQRHHHHDHHGRLHKATNKNLRSSLPFPSSRLPDARAPVQRKSELWPSRPSRPDAPGAPAGGRRDVAERGAFEGGGFLKKLSPQTAVPESFDNMYQPKGGAKIHFEKLSCSKNMTSSWLSGTSPSHPRACLYLPSQVG